MVQYIVKCILHQAVTQFGLHFITCLLFHIKIQYMAIQIVTDPFGYIFLLKFPALIWFTR